MSEQVGSVTRKKSSEFHGGIRFQSSFTIRLELEDKKFLKIDIICLYERGIVSGTKSQPLARTPPPSQHGIYIDRCITWASTSLFLRLLKKRIICLIIQGQVRWPKHLVSYYT